MWQILDFLLYKIKFSYYMDSHMDLVSNGSLEMFHGILIDTQSMKINVKFLKGCQHLSVS